MEGVLFDDLLPMTSLAEAEEDGETMPDDLWLAKRSDKSEEVEDDGASEERKVSRIDFSARWAWGWAAPLTTGMPRDFFALSFSICTLKKRIITNGVGNNLTIIYMEQAELF